MELTEEVVALALLDAGVGKTEIQHAYVGNAAAGLLQGQEMIRGQILLRNTGLLGSAVVNVENACSSSSTAFFLAVMAVKSGFADIAMAIGVEQLRIAQKARSFAALASATDTLRRPEMHEYVERYAFGGLLDDGMIPASPLMDHYSLKGREYLEQTGATIEDLARVVVKSRSLGSHNPRAQFQKELSIEEVLGGRLISAPLTIAMCSALSDGAAAVVVASRDVARRLARADIRVRAVTVTSNNPDGGVSPTMVAGERAYAFASVEPGDIDFAEVHDAAAPAELIIMEELGLASPGSAFELLRREQTLPGGTMPINSSGGLLSRGHPIGATGCAQIVELTEQLRGSAGQRQVPEARLGLAQNGGGVLERDEATVSVTILERTH